MTDRKSVRDARAVVCFFPVPRAAMYVHVKKERRSFGKTGYDAEPYAMHRNARLLKSVLFSPSARKGSG